MLAPSMAWALLQEGRVQMIDVRGRDEVDRPRIPGARAMKALRAAGITASAVDGGVPAWRKAGLPIEHSVIQDPPGPP